MDVPGGTHSLYVIDDNSCGPEIVNGIYIPVGLNDIAGNVIRVYPNPSSGVFILEMLSTSGGEFRIQIFSTNGSAVFDQVMNFGNAQDNKFEVNLSSEMSGLFLLKINGITIDTKLVIR
jgi:hypothetical protein